jgi:hypothetical protein
MHHIVPVRGNHRTEQTHLRGASPASGQSAHGPFAKPRCASASLLGTNLLESISLKHGTSLADLHRFAGYDYSLVSAERTKRMPSAALTHSLTHSYMCTIGREFAFDSVLALWDVIFAEDTSLEIVNHICLVSAPTTMRGAC